jgi:hypothetical protein
MYSCVCVHTEKQRIREKAQCDGRRVIRAAGGGVLRCSRQVEGRLRKLQARAAAKQRATRKRPDPPTLQAYLRATFEAADGDRRGRLSADAFLATLAGMGLGLQKPDLNGMRGTLHARRATSFFHVNPCNVL